MGSKDEFTLGLFFPAGMAARPLMKMKFTFKMVAPVFPFCL
jgi:hypothetical protein